MKERFGKMYKNVCIVSYLATRAYVHSSHETHFPFTNVWRVKRAAADTENEDGNALSRGEVWSATALQVGSEAKRCHMRKGMLRLGHEAVHSTDEPALRRLDSFGQKFGIPLLYYPTAISP